MLNIFTLVNGRLFQEEIESLEELSRFQPVWVDLESPTVEEKRWIKQYYGLQIPEDAMDEDIEESARFYEEDNGELHIRSDFLIADDAEPRTVRCAFILNQHNTDLRSRGVLFSIHDEDVPVFRLLRMRARRAPGLIEDAKEVLLKLFDADAEYSADTLEGIYDELEKAGKQVLSGDVTDAMAGEVLGAIARQEDLNGRIRRNVMDTLDSHTAFLFDKINFLMDATVGFININQNKIIKIFSVASVALLPPTLIASIYGMNFQYMPELNQSWGYPFAIALMAASAVVPMWYFRRRGWLK
jgi:magnesium transporter